MVMFGSMLGAVCCFLMPAAGSLGVLIGVWAANGLFQSMLWSPILRVFSETIDESLSKKSNSEYRTVTSCRYGSGISYVVNDY